MARHFVKLGPNVVHGMSSCKTLAFCIARFKSPDVSTRAEVLSIGPTQFQNEARELLEMCNSTAFDRSRHGHEKHAGVQTK